MVHRAILALFLVWCAPVYAAPPIEAYGELPEIRSMALSPDGAHVAYLSSKDGLETLNIYKLDEGIVAAIDTKNVKARSVSFAGPDYVILSAGTTTRVSGYIGRLEYTGAFAYSLKKQRITPLPRRMKELYPAQEGLGRIVGLYHDGKQVMMPAYTGVGQNPPKDLIRINLDTGNGRIVKRGRNATRDWVVQNDGTILARIDYDNGSNQFEIFTEADGRMTKIYEQVSPRIPFSVRGVKPDNSGLVLFSNDGSGKNAALYELGFNGGLSGPVFARAGSDVGHVISNIDRVVLGAMFDGFYPEYEFFDKDLTTAFVGVQGYFSKSAAHLISWTDDFQKLLVYAAGGDTSGSYFIYDREQNNLQRIARSRPEIAPEHVAEVLTIRYNASDGLSIPALLTMPLSGVTENAPLIVLPHGGPESHDSVGFDWIAQFFASRGYMVLQPNFRGSDGFGLEFRDAGRGEWGGKMQDDITDGVRAMINSGRADPSRICIVGGSYGGYAALAGGAFTPDLYQCVAAIAPVADLQMMLRTERQDHGAEHWVVDYWSELIGDPRAEKDKLDAISPTNSAASFQAPVLLIHGKDDLVVPLAQSRAMERALKDAGKEVELVTLKGEDHWLSGGETRLETLKALDAFVTKHIGANAAN